MGTKALSALQVIGVRYRSDEWAEGDERALDRFVASGAYQQAGVPVEIVEPRFPEERRSDDGAQNLGLLGGAIADAVAQARREGKAILMTGGNCTHCTGVLGGLQDAHGPAARIGLVWFDAHGDFNTPTISRSGFLGGMPVAVCAGLAWPRWREGSHIVAPLPTDRIVLVDVRNLDPAEEQLIRATGVVVAAAAPGFPGQDLGRAIAGLAGRCDLLYLHVDADVLDESAVPSHGYKEPDGPAIDQVLAAIDTVMATGKVVAFAVVSVYGEGKGSQRTVASGIELIRGGLAAWRRHGIPDVTAR
jgi:arginase